MPVISISTIESEEYVVLGIPRTITVSTNVSSVIFYTLDGSTPTINSTIYIDGIKLPTNQFDVVVKIYATNYIDSSPVVELQYSSVDDVAQRRPHASTDSDINKTTNLLFPLGSDNSADQMKSEYFSSGDTGITVDDPLIANDGYIGYDGNGDPTGFSDKPMNTENYSIRYNYDENRNYIGVGTLPQKSTFIRKSDYVQESEMYEPLFNPKAMVIYQDLSKEDMDAPPIINKQFFSLEDASAKDGAYYNNTGIGGDVFSGSFLRQHFNPRDNTMNYYYRDSRTNQWIISKVPYQPKANFGNLSNYIISRSGGAGVVLPWLPYQRRYLF